MFHQIKRQKCKNCLGSLWVGRWISVWYGNLETHPVTGKTNCVLILRIICHSEYKGAALKLTNNRIHNNANIFISLFLTLAYVYIKFND